MFLPVSGFITRVCDEREKSIVMTTVVVTDEIQVVGSGFVDKSDCCPNSNGRKGAEDFLELVISFILNLKNSSIGIMLETSKYCLP